MQAHRPKPDRMTIRMEGQIRTLLAIGASFGAIAFVSALPAPAADATPAGSGAAISTTVPAGEIEAIISRLPATGLGLSEAELSQALAEASEKANPLLGSLTSKLTPLVHELLEGDPKAEVSELVSSVNSLLTSLLGKEIDLSEVLGGLTPEQMTHSLEGLLGTEGLHQLIDGLAGHISELGSEGAQALRGILAALTASLPAELGTASPAIEKALEEAGEGPLRSVLEALKKTEGLSTSALSQIEALLSDLSSLTPTGLHERLEGLLAILTPQEASALLMDMVGTLTPAQLTGVVEGLLGGLGAITVTKTPQELVEANGSSLNAVASELGTTVEGLPATLPAATTLLGKGGPALSLVDGLGHLALSLSGASASGEEHSSEASTGGQSGSGGGTASGSGGSGTGSGLTVVVNNYAAASPSAKGAAKAPKVRILNHWVRGSIAVVALHVPSAGRLVLKGKGLRREIRRVQRARRIVLRVRLTKASIAALRHHRRRALRLRLAAIFWPTHAIRTMATAMLTFHWHGHAHRHG